MDGARGLRTPLSPALTADRNRKAGQNPLPGVIDSQIVLEVLPTYLLVAVDGGVFVAGAVLGFSSLLQPVTKPPITSPNSTIRVYSLFIVAVTFTNSRKRTRKIFGLKMPVF